MVTCPYCEKSQSQAKAGMNKGAQRYRCGLCNRRYTPVVQSRGYSEELRRQAVDLHARGIKIRQIGRQLGVNPQNIVNWVRRQEGVSVGDTAAVVAETGPPGPETSTLTRRRPTITDVAERAGVSPSTISNYLNNKGRMAEDTRVRITDAMEALHFTPSALVRAIRQRRTRILGVVIFGLTSLDEGVGVSVTPPILRGINDGADWNEHDLLLYTGWPHRPQRHTGLNFLDGHVDGLLWVGPAMHEPAMERAAAAGLPVVALLTRHAPDGVGYVNADNLAAMQVLVTHLANSGRKRIAYIGPAHSSNYLDRRNGYRQALAAAGLTRDPALEVTLKGDYWLRPHHERALEQWLALPVRPDAIIVPDDAWAGWIVEAIRERGLRVPEDIAVTGFNDVPDAARIGGGVTTIRQPFRRIGQVAVEKLLALIEGAPIEDCRVTLPTELILRASTARAPDR